MHYNVEFYCENEVHMLLFQMLYSFQILCFGVYFITFKAMYVIYETLCYLLSMSILLECHVVDYM